MIVPTNATARRLLSTIATVIVLGTEFPCDADEKFAVLPFGDAILLPVRIGGETHSFLLDTGATASVFDRALVAGDPVDRHELQTGGGVVVVERFKAPQATIAGKPLTAGEPVYVFDLAHVRRASGLPIRGIVGMEFLRSRIVRIDFDGGVVEFVDAVPPDAGREVPLSVRNGSPTLVVEVPGLGDVDFLIDTGGVGAAIIDEAMFEKLMHAGKLSSIAKARSLTAAGEVETPIARLESIRVADFAIPNLQVQSRAGDARTLGLDVWSRFSVTLDFPGGKLHLKPGRFFDKHDRRNLAGMRFRRTDNGTPILGVDPGSAAANAGLRVGDDLIQIGKRPTAGATQTVLDRRLSIPGDEVTIVFRHEGREQKTTIKLPMP